MANSIIDRICNTCSCGQMQAQEYLDDEIRTLQELRDLADLRSGDLEVACDNLGLEHDYVEYFIHALAS